MIIHVGDFKVFKYIYDYQAGFSIHIRKEQMSWKNQVTTVTEF